MDKKSIKKMLRKNVRVKKDELKKLQGMLEKLEQHGVNLDTYGLESPFSRQGGKRDVNDPRTVCIRIT